MRDLKKYESKPRTIKRYTKFADETLTSSNL